MKYDRIAFMRKHRSESMDPIKEAKYPVKTHGRGMPIDYISPDGTDAEWVKVHNGDLRYWHDLIPADVGTGSKT